MDIPPLDFKSNVSTFPPQWPKYPINKLKLAEGGLEPTYSDHEPDDLPLVHST